MDPTGKKAAKRGGKLLWLAMLIMCSAILTACLTRPVVVLPESRVVHLKAGDVAPYEGFLLTPGAYVELAEEVEGK